METTVIALKIRRESNWFMICLFLINAIQERRLSKGKIKDKYIIYL